MKKPYLQEVRTYRGGTEIRICDAQRPDLVAQLAINIIDRWALVAAYPDGEDSAGRQKLRLPTPEELVSRATAIAVEAYAVFGRCGLLIDLPEPQIPKED